MPADNIKYLTDDRDDTLLHPTRHNILKGFGWLMTDLQPGDSLFFSFAGKSLPFSYVAYCTYPHPASLAIAGHGDTQVDPTGKEPRGNQVICPCDYSTRGVITDTDIHNRLVSRLPLVSVEADALRQRCRHKSGARVRLAAETQARSVLL